MKNYTLHKYFCNLFAQYGHILEKNDRSLRF